MVKHLVFLTALAMPIIAWLSSAGVFGPTNAVISDRYPTLIIAAGYAFAIWGPIFLLDVVYGSLQWFLDGRDARLQRIRPWTACGFALTALWMIVFSLQWFWLALAIIWASLACLLHAAAQVSDTANQRHGPWWQWMPLSLHAGWVSLAVFLNLAQVIVAFELLSTTRMLPWTLVLLGLAGALLVSVLVKLRGNPWYALAALWGLVGVFIKQRAAPLDGATVAAWVAMALALCVLGVAIACRPGRQHSRREAST